VGYWWPACLISMSQFLSFCPVFGLFCGFFA